MEGTSLPALPGNGDDKSSVPAQPSLPHRACEECKRKKTRCDMGRPSCSLCVRIGSSCEYPTRRKTPNKLASTPIKKSTDVPKVDNEKLARLIQLLETDQLENLLGATSTPRGDVTQTNTTQECRVEGSTNVQTIEVVGTSNLDYDGRLVPSNAGTVAANLASSSFPSQGIVDGVLTPASGFVRNATSTEALLPNESTVNNGQEPLSWPGMGNERDLSDIWENFDDLLNSSWQYEDYSDPSPSPSQHNSGGTASFSIPVPPETGDHLVDLWFERIQSFLPLFHRPTFYSDVAKIDRTDQTRYLNLSWDSALILNGMFALAARFSQRDDGFGTSEPIKRGEPFAQRALRLWDYARRTNAGDSPTLFYLQGSILVAYYQLTSGPGFRAWISVGVCVRIAYDLSLHTLDRRRAVDLDTSVEQWAKDEEKRRAWWAVFEIDTFSSVLSCRPFVTDMHRMNVLLPVSDESWYTLRPVQSASLLSNGPSMAWKSLVGCENQSEHAWFLVSNFVMRRTHEARENEGTSEEALEALRTGIQCFALSLPSNYRLNEYNLQFDETNFAGNNWILCVHLMILGAKSFIMLIEKDVVSTHSLSNIQTPEDSHTDAVSPGTPSSRSAVQCSPQTNEVNRILRHWSPDFIPFAFPLIACAMIGPDSVHITPKTQTQEPEILDNLRFMHRQMLELVLKRIGEYWTIGLQLQELLRFLDSSTPIATIAASRPDIARFRALMPASSHNKPSSTPSSHHINAR